VYPATKTSSEKPICVWILWNAVDAGRHCEEAKPTNATPGLIYMLNGAQRSYADPFWPFDAKAAELPTVMRDAGTLVMLASTSMLICKFVDQSVFTGFRGDGGMLAKME
jgi:hypothetical protein